MSLFLRYGNVKLPAILTVKVQTKKNVKQQYLFKNIKKYHQCYSDCTVLLIIILNEFLLYFFLFDSLNG